MSRCLPIWICVGLVVAPAAPTLAQHVAPSAPSAAVTAQAAQADIAMLREFVSRDRSYSETGRAAALARIDRLEAQADALAPAMINIEAGRIAALADNGHTLNISSIWASGQPRIPYRLAAMQGRFYVLDAGDDVEALGAELLSIDDVPTAVIRQAFDAQMGGESGFKDYIAPVFMESPPLLHAAGLITDPHSLRIVLETPAGRILERTVTPRITPGAPGFNIGNSALRTSGLRETAPNGAPQPLYLRESGAPFMLADLPELQAVYVALRTTRDDGGIRIADFLAEARGRIDERRPRNVIVDLRFNNGGDLNTARAFMAGLPGQIPENGRIYAITSGATFSAAISSLGYLKQAGADRVVIVGEPVGDRLEFWAEGDVIRLPHSGALMLYATERHNYRTGCQEEDCHGSIRLNPIRVATLDPDIAAPMTIVAFMTGRDPAMEVITTDIAARD